MKHFLYVLVVIVFLLGIVTGCSAQNAPTLTDGKNVLCNSLATLRTSATNLQAIDADTSVAQLRAMRENIGKLVEAARRANTVLQLQAITDMVDSYEGFSRMVDSLNPEQNVGDAAAALNASSAKVLAALEQAYLSAQCAQ
jgi:hypothetical protein